MSSIYWTPYCPKKQDYKHDKKCPRDDFCGFCGKQNPKTRNAVDSTENPSSPSTQSSDSSVIITDERECSPSALDVPSIASLEHQQQAVLQARQNAIVKYAKAKNLPNAGSKALSSRPKPPAKKPTVITLNIALFFAEVKNPNVKTFNKWEPSISVTTEIDLDTTFNTQDDFLLILTENIEAWDDITAKTEITDKMIARNVDARFGPQGVPPPNAWQDYSFGEFIKKYAKATTIANKTSYELCLCVGWRPEDDLKEDSFSSTQKTKQKGKKVEIKKEPKVEIKKEPKDSKKKTVKKSNSNLKIDKPITKKRSFSDYIKTAQEIIQDQQKSQRTSKESDLEFLLQFATSDGEETAAPDGEETAAPDEEETAIPDEEETAIPDEKEMATVGEITTEKDLLDAPSNRTRRRLERR